MQPCRFTWSCAKAVSSALSCGPLMPGTSLREPASKLAASASQRAFARPHSAVSRGWVTQPSADEDARSSAASLNGTSLQSPYEALKNIATSSSP